MIQRLRRAYSLSAALPIRSGARSLAQQSRITARLASRQFAISTDRQAAVNEPIWLAERMVIVP